MNFPGRAAIPGSGKAMPYGRSVLLAPIALRAITIQVVVVRGRSHVISFVLLLPIAGYRYLLFLQAHRSRLSLLDLNAVCPDHPNRVVHGYRHLQTPTAIVLSSSAGQIGSPACIPRRPGPKKRT